jgi:DNA-binding response OmpR family regulator
MIRKGELNMSAGAFARLAAAVTPTLTVEEVVSKDGEMEPYEPLSAREHAAHIRGIPRGTTLSVEQTAWFGDVEVDLERRYIRRRGEEVKMTPAEYNLLAFFLRNADRPLTRAAILKQAWGYAVYPHTRTVDVHVVKLRRKLESDPSAPRHFLTIHGVGYRFKMNPTGRREFLR